MIWSAWKLKRTKWKYQEARKERTDAEWRFLKGLNLKNNMIDDGWQECVLFRLIIQFPFLDLEFTQTFTELKREPSRSLCFGRVWMSRSISPHPLRLLKILYYRHTPFSEVTVSPNQMLLITLSVIISSLCDLFSSLFREKILK